MKATPTLERPTLQFVFVRSLRTLGSLCLALLVSPAFATDYTITVPGDTVSNNGNCTLREAIRAVNLGVAVDQCPAGGATNQIFLLPTVSYLFDGGDEVLTNRNLLIIGTGATPEDTSVGLGFADRFLDAQGGHLELRNLSVSFGMATGDGGALRVRNGDLTLDRARFVLNRTTLDGGAVSFETDTGTTHDLHIVDSFFGINAAGTQGGGVQALLLGGGSIEIIRTEFTGNQVRGDVGTSGGAMEIDAAGGEVLISYVLAENNSIGDSPSVSHRGGALSLRTDGNAVALVEDSLFDSNGVEIAGATSGPTDTQQINLLSTLTSSISFVRNRVLDGTINTSPPGSSISARADDTSSLELSNLVVAGGPGNGLGVSANDASQMTIGQVTVNDFVFAGIRYLREAGAGLSIANSVSWNNGTDLSGSALSSPPTLITNLIGVDPLVLDAAGRDYRLLPISPARDAGTNGAPGTGTLDVLHGPRVSGPAPDQGAHEFGSIFESGFEKGNFSEWSLVVN